MLFRSISPPLLAALFLLSSCAESHNTCTVGCPDASGPDAGDVDAGDVDAGDVDGGDVDGGDGCSSRTPVAHRSAGSTCDPDRPPGSTPEPSGGPPSSCASDADCTDGTNGRCTGNPHDGWRCTYDTCFADADCDPNSVCECDGGFRSGANVCLPGNCRTDDDCGGAFCSPSFGGCGEYSGTVGYFCHTCEDECVDDSDCQDLDAGVGGWGAPYCAFDPTAGRWMCSALHCAG